jgi:hypothetical protein
MNNIFYYLILVGMVCYTVIDYTGGHFTRSGLWLMIAAVMVIIHEIKNFSKPILYDNCTFITTTQEGNKEKDNSYNGK